MCVLLHRKRLEWAPARQIAKLVKVGQNKNIRIRLGAIKYFMMLMTTMEQNQNRKNSGIFTNNVLIIWCYLNLVVLNLKMMYTIVSSSSFDLKKKQLENYLHFLK